jgi:hypothetical protein
MELPFVGGGIVIDVTVDMVDVVDVVVLDVDSMVPFTEEALYVK